MSIEQKEVIQKVYSYCRRFYKENNQFPKLGDVKVDNGISNKTLQSILKVLVYNNYIKQSKNFRYYFPDQEIVTHKKLSRDQLYPQKNFSLWLALNKVKVSRLAIFKVIIAVVFVAVLYLGIKYNYYYFSITKSKLDALVSAICFFVFGIVSFECGVLFWGKKKWYIGTIFFFIFLVIFISNLINIVYSQYDKYQNLVYSEQRISENTDSILYDDYLKKEGELEIELANRIREREMYSKRIEDNTSDRIALNNVWTITNRSIPALNKQLEDTRSEIRKLLVEKKVIKSERATIYEFLSKLFRIRVETLQFLHIMFPAFVLDIIASISLALLFFMKSEN